MKPPTPYPPLVELATRPFPVYVSEGTEGRARQIAERCWQAHGYLSETFHFEPALKILVLAPEHWQDYAEYMPYGMPQITNSETIVVAGENNDFWKDMSPPADALPRRAAKSMRAAYGSPSGPIDLSLFFDLLVVHEMGHLFHKQASIQFPRLWLMELFCNMCLHAYVAEMEPQLLPALEVFPAVVAGGEISHLRHHTLDDFEHLYIEVGPVNYGWYQCRLHVAAKDIFNAGGVRPLQRLWALFRQTNAAMTDGELAAWLRDEIHPVAAQVLSQWPP